MSNTVLHKADSRGHADYGWLNAHHSFSFASYYDPSRIHFGVLRVLNDDTVAPGMGFGKHPHDNMEIITIILNGTIEHKDSMGHAEQIHENEVQVMSAGTGITHSEYNPDRDNKLSLLQIWIFPEEQNVQPRYDQRMFTPEERINKLQTIVSPMNKTDEGLKIHQQAWIYRGTLDAGTSLQHKLHTSGNGIYAFVIDGAATIAGSELQKRDALGISQTEQIEIVANEKTDLLLLEVPM